MPFGEARDLGFNNQPLARLLVANSIINKKGMFFYSGTPAFGNLIESVGVSAGGTDAFGNAYLPGDTTYTGAGPVIASQLFSGALQFQSAATPAGPFTVSASISTTTSPSELTIGNNNATEFIVLPSGDATGVTDALIINGIAHAFGNINKPVIIRLLASTGSTYFVKAGSVVIPFPSIYIEGAGTWATIIKGVGTGDVIRQYTTVNYSSGGGGPAGGGVKHLMIDMSGMGANSSGLHAGDLYNYDVEGLGVRAGSAPAGGIIPVWFDNQYATNGMEQLHGRIWVENGTDASVKFDLNPQPTFTPTGSFDRMNLEVNWDGKGHGDGVTFNNGAFCGDGKLSIKGNTDYGSSLHYVLKLTGNNGAGSYSRIFNTVIDIGVECNAIVGTQPRTIDFDSAQNNTILQSSGHINFSGNNPFDNANNALGSFQFDGPVEGDLRLSRSLDLGSNPFQHGAMANGDTIQTRFLTKNKVTTTVNVSGIILQGFPPDDHTRLFILENKGTGTITFDPTPATSNVADSNAGDVVNPNTAAMFEWDNDDQLWYRIR